MGLAWAVAMMVVCVVVCWAISYWDAKTACRMMEHTQHFFESDNERDGKVRSHMNALGVQKIKRKHFTPLVSKQVAARQRFRCAICGRLFDDQLWDLDHITPLFRGGSNDLSNIRALCRACHMDVSARQRAS